MGWNHQPVNYMYLHVPWKSTIHVGKYTMHGSCTYLSLPKVWNLDPIKIKLRGEIWQANRGSKWITKQEVSHQELVFCVYFGWVIFFGSQPILLNTPWAHCHHTCSQYWYIVSPTRIFVSGEKKAIKFGAWSFSCESNLFPEASNELGIFRTKLPTRCLFCLGVIPRDHHEFVTPFEANNNRIFSPIISGT